MLAVSICFIVRVRVYDWIPDKRNSVITLDDIDAEKAPERISQTYENRQDDENSFQYFVWYVFSRPRPDHCADENTVQFGTDHGPIYLDTFQHHKIENGEDHSNQNR
jgi:hypothetical protein